ncbi:MAG: hypothetical protein MI673_06140 [Thiotrichales bacterium]|nr:hypothetical protein [Thiotrichales bacterium]
MELSGLTRTLSRFELAVCLIIIAILFAYAIRKISELSVHTEQTGVKIIIRNMQSNLDLYKSGKIISGTLDEMADLVRTNPVGRIIPPPEGYLGEFESPDPARFSPGDWYFDKSEGHLVYHVVHPDRFVSPVPAPPRIRLQLAPIYVDLNENELFDHGTDRISSLTIKSIEKYDWR